MSQIPEALQPLIDALPTLFGRLIASPKGARLLGIPPISWIVRSAVRSRARQLIDAPIAPVVAPPAIPRTTLQAKLDGIARDVVETLGYFAAMVATYDHGDILAIKSIYMDPAVASQDQLQYWEQEVSRFTSRPVSLLDPAVARVDVRDPAFAENLSYIAANTLQPQIRNDLHCLFVPIVPDAARPVLAEIQILLGIRQVVAIPFFQEATAEDGRVVRELVGNLFALKRDQITQRDVAVLSAFGRQAASALQNERLNLQVRLVQELVVEIQRNLESEERILELIASGVVEQLGYVGAMVTTVDTDNTLPIRSFSLDPNAAASARRQLSEYIGAMSAANPQQRRISLESDQRVNLNVAAAHAQRPLAGVDLYALLTPALAEGQRAILAQAQRALRIRHVIAIPFYLPTSETNDVPELVGTLMAFSRSRFFSRGEIQLLQAFAQQAAVGIHNAQIYRRSESRRKAAEIFGKMAFSASASAHALRNHVGAVRTNLQLIRMVDQLAPEQRREVFEHIPAMIDRLTNATELLDHLDRPSQIEPESATDLVECLHKALRRVADQQASWVNVEYDQPLQPLHTVPDMLSEAFKVLIKNAVEAVEERFSSELANGQAARPRQLLVRARQHSPTTIEVVIRDNGQGIRREHVRRIFDLGWTTKKGVGYGFGLFWTIDYIEGLGGRIEVESTWGEGTTFRLWLPCLPASIPHTSTAHSESVTPDPGILKPE
ncbi:MAG: hypothetical protein Fur005_13040 [Roseiflexaceae bacterium]